MPDDDLVSLIGFKTPNSTNNDSQEGTAETFNASVDMPAQSDPLGYHHEELHTLNTKVDLLESSISKKVTDDIQSSMPSIIVDALKQILLLMFKDMVLLLKAAEVFKKANDEERSGRNTTWGATTSSRVIECRTSPPDNKENALVLHASVEKSSEENTSEKKVSHDEPLVKKLKFLIPTSSSILSPTPLNLVLPEPIQKHDRPTPPEIQPYLEINPKGKWVLSQAKALGIPPPSELSTFRVSINDKKRKRSSEILQEIFVKENIVVDEMHKNLVPPPGVEGRRGMVIREPESGVFFYNGNFDLVFQREEEFHLATTPQLIRLQNGILRRTPEAEEFFKKLDLTFDVGKSHNVLGIAPVAIIDRQLPFEYTITSRSTHVVVPISPAPPTDSEYLRSGMRYMIHNEELKSMFEKQAGVEWFDLIQTFHACKQDEKSNKKSLKVKGKGKANGKGKAKQVYIPKPKNPEPFAKEHPTKDDTCHQCKEVGHCKRNYPTYLAELIKKKKQVGTASSSDLKQVKAIGSFDFVLPNGLVICLDNSHYAPSITRGVVSIHRLVENRFVQHFTDFGISVSKNNVHYFNVIPSNGVYEIDMHNLVPNVNSIYNVSTKRAKHNLDSTYLWHCRLVHISKITRKLFPHRPERATDLLGIIHTDVCGHLDMCQNKVFETFKVFKNEMENQLGKTVKAL
ncbi:hypothetical protein Tco_0539851 [Tanacetum coccineum]